MRKGSRLPAGPFKTKGRSACLTRSLDAETIENPPDSPETVLRELAPCTGIYNNCTGTRAEVPVQYSTLSVSLLADGTNSNFRERLDHVELQLEASRIRSNFLGCSARACYRQNFVGGGIRSRLNTGPVEEINRIGLRPLNLLVCSACEAQAP